MAGVYRIRFIVILVSTILSIESASLSRRAVIEIDNPDYLLDLITRLGQSIVRANELEKFVRSSGSSKRGLDLGLGRGFTGSQAAKHLMGLAAANFAGGPGRKRRSSPDEASNHPNEALTKFNEALTHPNEALTHPNEALTQKMA
ncbi:hypothetical protein Pcinc_011425 [Petrolisthes cinctipes]|uniref:Diuretic hormone class 2 n=2 Tax=Petrolisthes cinctipes TaxID=88211 RepID=A0AAE1FUZ7_PETCI|nr:hypothetical protein Pcinc_016819 [Petrolisthes cinctipes]KAK3880286.1 hypothetical protein Pcinc_015213 [Petrolisthes cinctipes]KAK3884293.1 hypothetical protein Pcinc_011425 [Petrolisthes cinctipes]